MPQAATAASTPERKHPRAKAESRSHREVLRASLGLLEKQSQHTDSDNAGRMRLRGFSFPSTGEEKPSACELFR
ncbi:hypothetical protein R6Z07F_007156 [Ovis aries]